MHRSRRRLKFRRRTSAERFPEAQPRSGAALKRVEDASPPPLPPGAQERVPTLDAQQPDEQAHQLAARVGDPQAQAEARLAEHATALERTVNERLDEEIARRYQALAERLGEQAQESRLEAQAQLTEHAAALERAGEERAQRADAARVEQARQAEAARAEEVASQLADGRERLERLASELRASAAEAGRNAAEATAKADRRVLKQAEDLYSKAARALAQTDALAEQFAELSSALVVQRAQMGRSGILRDATPAGSRAAPLDANEATLDELRDLKLSLTQATRIIEYRDLLGGFTSIEQLDEVPGISKGLRADLKRRLTIRTAGTEVGPGTRIPAISANAGSAGQRARR